MIIFTDASYMQQTKVSGYGFVIVDKKFNHRAGGFSFECKNNNIAEVGAIESALKFAKRFDLFTNTDDKNLVIITDSTYALNRIQRPHSSYNDKEIKMLENIRTILQECPLKYTIFHIKGHGKDDSKFSEYNNLADQIAASYRYLGEIEKQKQISFAIRKKKSKRGRK